MSRSRFESTVWLTIWKARDNDPGALDDFVRRYRAPIERFIAQNGFGQADAEELSQEVFLRIFKNNVLKKARRDRGRFRSLLLTLTRHVIQDERRRRGAAKRGGDHVIVSPQHNSEDSPSLEELVASHTEDREFDNLWVRNILKLALEKLRAENEPYYTAFTMNLDDYDYKAIAERMDKSPKEVDNYVYRARQKLIRLIRDEIATYASSPQEYRDEVQYLSGYLSGATGRAEKSHK
jgi:RNA polymerase sigma factor (sigma-70 family)